jgi:hypothetical protein
VPYVVGVLTHVTPAELDLEVGQRGLAARAVGLVPGFLAETISGKIGVAGAVLLGFLALSALTLATFAWHPLQRLEAGRRDVGEATQSADWRKDGRVEGGVERGERPSAPSTGSGQTRPSEV